MAKGQKRSTREAKKPKGGGKKAASDAASANQLPPRPGLRANDTASKRAGK